MAIDQFFVAGINYKKTDAHIRGQFAVGPDQYAILLQKASLYGLQEVFVLSTCNRTEIYGLADNAAVLIELLCSVTTGSAAVFTEGCYIRQGHEAINHIFAVGAGLDSQILGDYEIVGQMKQAVKFAKERNCIGAFMERLFNTVLQASKTIKNETALSGGTISVSFAAIQFLKSRLIDHSSQQILLLGTGKIGRNTCKNLIDYLGIKDIVLINRTPEKAVELANEMGLKAAPYESLEQQVQDASVIIVATNASSPVIAHQQLINSTPKILIDLSIPNHIEPAAGTLAHITLANVDDLSKINDETLLKRKAEVPKALTIIETHKAEFEEWLSLRSHVPVLKAVKQKLQDMHSCKIFRSAHQQLSSTPIDKAAIQKVVNNVALKMRYQHQPGCHYIEAINDFMTSSTN